MWQDADKQGSIAHSQAFEIMPVLSLIDFVKFDLSATVMTFSKVYGSFRQYYFDL